MAIQINGSGTITGISAGGLPAGSVTSATLADGAASGTKLTMPSGSVIQMVQSLAYSRAEVNSSTFTATHSSVSITPTKANSKILYSFNGDCNNNGDGYYMHLTVYRNIAGAGWVENAPNGGTSNFGFTRNGETGDRQEVPYNILYLDSPSYTLGQSIEYKLYIRNDGAGTVELPCSPSREPAIAIAQEIAA
jgi:hypothetical protein